MVLSIGKIANQKTILPGTVMQPKTLGVISIVCGIILIIFALPILTYFAFLIVGLMLINYGFKLLRMPTLWQRLQILFFRGRF
ncbi:hypothetical protein KJZ61_01495 [Candidatus Dependentiae bacterium]|nr:hypothetical protein [Candidatus Dependentiae bacterium]